MHYFKLFLAASFAVSASGKGLLTLISAYDPVALPDILLSAPAVASTLGAVVSFAAGAFIATRLRRHNVPKGRHPL